MRKNLTNDGLMTPEQVHTLLRGVISARTIRTWAREGKISFTRKTPGGHYRFSYADVERIRIYIATR